jgi:hypothetical protein
VAIRPPLAPVHGPGSLRSLKASAAPASIAALMPRSQRLRLRSDADGGWLAVLSRRPRERCRGSGLWCWWRREDEGG